MLEPAGVSELLEKLRTKYPRLGEQTGVDAFFGIKTGFNDAFYIDAPTRDQLIEENLNCEPLLRKLLRGRTIGRWRPVWNSEWMIAIASSSNHNWPWSDCEDEGEAEAIFRQTFPPLYDHLKKHERRLRARQDQGRFWWELRSCDYYEALDRPKIVVKRIMYHSDFCWDLEGFWVNDSTVFLNTSDSYLLAILNSRVIWWYVFRLWPHMKDEALRAQNRRLLSIPVPEVSEDLRSKIEKLVWQAYKIAGQEENLSDLLDIESEIQDYVVEAYGLTSAEIALIDRTLPLRDPLVVLEKRVRKS
jgi:adenine-specific DNA-methyltransferase